MPLKVNLANPVLKLLDKTMLSNCFEITALKDLSETPPYK